MVPLRKLSTVFRCCFREEGRIVANVWFAWASSERKHVSTRRVVDPAKVRKDEHDPYIWSPPEN
jgi:hypothetical protein